MKIHLKRLGIVYILTVIFLSKSECPDKMRPRAGHIGIGPPKLISFKTRHDLHSVEKKVYPKILKLSIVILIDKVGFKFIFHWNGVTRPVSSSIVLGSPYSIVIKPYRPLQVSNLNDWIMSWRTLLTWNSLFFISDQNLRP